MLALYSSASCWKVLWSGAGTAVPRLGSISPIVAVATDFHQSRVVSELNG